MHTGIKTIIQKISKKITSPTILLKGFSQNLFPKRQGSFALINIVLKGTELNLRKQGMEHNLGSLHTYAHKKTAKIYGQFAGFNPGNLGDWSDQVPNGNVTTKYEHEVIHKMINLYHGDQRTMSGYVSSGGSEANIFSVWLGRSYLTKKYRHKNVALIRSNLTHYSIKKAATICNIPQYLVALDSKEWGIHPKSIEIIVKKLVKTGVKGFLLPITIGYTSTGTSDNLDQILHTISILEKQYTGIHFYTWIDAAFNGLIEPFINQDFKPFSSSRVQGLVVDFHKFGLVPYSAGIILYRKQLKKYIEQPIDYLEETDATLLGSRSGIPAVSIWTMIHLFGQDGYRKLIMQQMANKQLLITKLQLLFPKIKIITNPNSLSCGIIFYSLKRQRLPKYIEDKYSLYPGNTEVTFYPNQHKELLIYKIFFLPHLKKKIVSEFITDVRKLSQITFSE